MTTKTYTVTWHDGRLVRDDDRTIVIDWDEPINASTDAYDVAIAVAGDDKIIAVDHDGEYVHVTVSY